MTDNFDYQEFVERHRTELVNRFRNPDIAAFETRYGRQIPPALQRLYDLGETLMNSPVEVVTDEGGIWIECFSPLSPESVAVGERYEWKYFEFAAGGENQAILISMEDPTRTFIDYESDGSDIEELPISFDRLVTEVAKHLTS